jgi:hypothetical protein
MVGGAILLLSNGYLGQQFSAQEFSCRSKTAKCKKGDSRGISLFEFFAFVRL